jgi:cysteine synthase B
MDFLTLEATVGNTPLVRLQRLPGGTSNAVLVKIRPGDTLIEATSGNTGIALAMAAAVRDYRMVLIMPETMSVERRAAMKAFGADIILVSKEAGMEGARDLALELQARGEGKVLDQFSNPDNPLAHYESTGPEIWRDTAGTVTHFVSAMGTTGTIMGTSRYLKEQSDAVQIVGVTPAEGSSIPGIRRWPEAYLPEIFDATRVDRTIEVSQHDAEITTRALAAQEGIFAGISSGGAVAAALALSREVEDAVIVAIICDRGDRYLSTGVFPD